MAEELVKLLRETLQALKESKTIGLKYKRDLTEILSMSHDSIEWFGEYEKEILPPENRTNSSFLSVLDDAFKDIIIMADGKVKLKGNITIHNLNMLSAHRQSRL